MSTIDTAAQLTAAISATVREIATKHETLGIDIADITVNRAERAVGATKVQTTTELLLLLARFHADVDDVKGASMLAEFAAKFAEVESTVV